MIVDALMLVGENRFEPTLAVTDALAIADELEIDIVVAAPARPLAYHLEPANERLAEAARRSGGRLVALGRVDPLNGETATREAERCLTELGCVGLFIHPDQEVFAAPQAANLLEVARDHRAPVVVATGHFARSEPLQVAQLAGSFPEVPVVMTTGGQMNITGLSMFDAWLALTSNANLHVMTNGEYRQDFIERLASEFDYRRVLYASFAPTFDARFEQKRVRSAHMSEVARRAIEGDNAGRLFGLSRG